MNQVQNQYYYHFLNEVSTELASIARELENSVFTSPRTMLTHSRVFVEGVVLRVLQIEIISDLGCEGLKDRLYLLKSERFSNRRTINSIAS